MRQRFDVVPIPDRSDGVELTQQLQQHTLGSGRFGSRGADPVRQPIGIPLLLLSSNQLRCRPVMDRDRLTCVATWYHPRPIMIIHNQLLVLPREPFQIRKRLRITSDSSREAQMKFESVWKQSSIGLRQAQPTHATAPA